MLRLYPSEIFRQVPIEVPLKFNYAVSNYGRLISYSDIFQDGREIKGGRSDGFRTLRYTKQKDGKKKGYYLMVYKLVAEFFMYKTSEEQKHVIHLDHSRDNDKVSNLKWVTREEMIEHSQKSPHVIAARLRRGHSDGIKLTSTDVIRLKKQLLNPNRKTRIKILAKQFGVSEMQLYRIKSGENWGHIKV
ncbi:MAG: hypothetical protein PSV16_05320 [Flavobacterium sp.]|nr:hypothetical protein [Flavobacterium sp.]